MELTKPLILEQIVKEGKFLRICQNITHKNELCDDLFQECILILLEQPEQRIIELYSKDELKPFFIRIVQNNYNSNTSQFFRKYKEFPSKCIDGHFEGSVKANNNSLVEDSVEIESEYDYEKLVDYINSGGTTRVEWFDSQVIKLLISEKNIYKLAKKTGINRDSLYSAINRFKEKINGSEEFKRRAI